MALLAKFNCSNVQQFGNGRYVLCDEGDEGAVKGHPASYYLEPGDADEHWQRWEPGISNINVELNAVASGGPDDPNQSFAAATPSGKLTMTIQNPAAFGFFEPGQEYVIEIRKAQPQKARR